jgi:hypothetical protein
LARSPKPASSIASSLKRSARGTQGYLDRLEKLHSAGHISQRDVTRSYEGAFLAYYTGLERHIERLFMGLIMSRLSPSGPKTRALVQISSDQTAHRVVSGGKRFSDWLPIEKTTKRAETYLSGGRPFDRLRPVDYEVLNRMHIIRNAVAHRSSHANLRFRRQLIEGNGIPPHQQTPAGYLRGQHTTGQSRLSYFIAQGVDTVDLICA